MKKNKLNEKEEYMMELIHNLRQPLQAIDGYSNIFLYEKKYDERMMKNINNASQMMRKMLIDGHDFLDEEFELRLKLYTSKEINDFLAENIIPLANEKGIEYILKNSNEFQIDMDLNMFYQAHTNIVTNSAEANATKLKQENSIDGDYFKMVFTDNGKGINHENLKKVRCCGFTDKPDGTARGINYLYNFANTFKGWVEINSIENIGTELEVVGLRKSK